MESKWTAIACVLLLCAFLIQGQGITSSSRCFCKKPSKKVNLNKLIKIEIFPRSSRCENIEVVATMKGTKKQKCLNQKMKLVNDIISGKSNRKLQHVKVTHHV